MSQHFPRSKKGRLARAAYNRRRRETRRLRRTLVNAAGRYYERAGRLVEAPRPTYRRVRAGWLRFDYAAGKWTIAEAGPEYGAEYQTAAGRRYVGGGVKIRYEIIDREPRKIPVTLARARGIDPKKTYEYQVKSADVIHEVVVHYEMSKKSLKKFERMGAEIHRWKSKKGREYWHIEMVKYRVETRTGRARGGFLRGWLQAGTEADVIHSAEWHEVKKRKRRKR